MKILIPIAAGQVLLFICQKSHFLLYAPLLFSRSILAARFISLNRVRIRDGSLNYCACKWSITEGNS